MSFARSVPERLAIPIIDDLFDAAIARMAPKQPEELSVTEEEGVMRSVADAYNESQREFDASVKALRGDCACGQCVAFGFGVFYRTYH